MIRLVTRIEGKYADAGFNAIVARLSPALFKAVDKIALTAESVAKLDYLQKKKKTPKMPSFIISSFTYDRPMVKGLSNISAVVQAGGPSAYWATYVDQGHSLRNSKGNFSGYHFMKAGILGAKQAAPGIIQAELNGL